MIMARQEKNIILVVGPPKSGIKLLKSGLNFLCTANAAGETTSDDGKNDPGLINDRLLRALGLSSYPAEGLPAGWQNTKAAGQAKQEIKNYLSETPAGSVPLILGDSLLAWFMPLWQAVFEELEIEPKMIHLTRHPWEVARALHKDEGLDLDRGHLTWLACYRNAVDAGLKHRSLLVVYEQLMEEPRLLFQRIGDELALSFNDGPGNSYSLQLGYAIQAEKRVFYADHMTAGEKELYSVFYRLYNTVAADQGQVGSLEIARILRSKLKSLLRFDLYPAYLAAMEQFYSLAADHHEGGMLKSRTFWGASINLIPREHLSAALYAFELIKPDISAFFVDYLKPGWTVFDVGAHLGYFSMLAATLVGGKGTVICFEPAPSTVDLLKENLRAFSQVTLVPQLVWHRDEKDLDFKVFELAHSAFNTAAANSLSIEQEKALDCSITRVQAVSLDAYSFEGDLKPDLVKIDVGGTERQVLEGMTGLLETVRPVVTLEVGHLRGQENEGIFSLESLLIFMQGYDYVALESVGYRLHVRGSVDQEAEGDQLILIPREKLPLVAKKYEVKQGLK